MQCRRVLAADLGTNAVHDIESWVVENDHVEALQVLGRRDGRIIDVRVGRKEEEVRADRVKEVRAWNGRDGE